MRNFTFFILLVFVFYAPAQKGVTTFGLQYNPIVPNRLIGTYIQDFDALPMESHIQQKFGNNLGGIVRHGFTKNISIETGLNFTQRNFNLFFELADSGFSEQNDVRIVSYSLPVSGLVFIRLTDQLWMNTSAGVAMTLFPSDVQVFTEVTGTNHFFLMEGLYRHKVQGALLTNLGFELRTKKFGFFYLGGTYHLPFAPICTFAMAYEFTGGDYVAIDNVKGSFVSVDIRYYFNEVREKKVGEGED